MLDGIIKQIEKGKPFFDKIAQNIYLGAVRDGFLTAMPAILFSSVFILAASIPEIFGIVLPLQYLIGYGKYTTIQWVLLVCWLRLLQLVV